MSLPNPRSAYFLLIVEHNLRQEFQTTIRKLTLSYRGRSRPNSSLVAPNRQQVAQQPTGMASQRWLHIVSCHIISYHIISYRIRAQITHREGGLTETQAVGRYIRSSTYIEQLVTNTYRAPVKSYLEQEQEQEQSRVVYSICRACLELRPVAVAGSIMLLPYAEGKQAYVVPMQSRASRVEYTQHSILLLVFQLFRWLVANPTPSHQDQTRGRFTYT